MTFLDDAKKLFPSEVVEIPELKRKVVVRGLSAREVDEIYNVDEGEKDEATISAQLLSRVLFDEDGKRLVPEDRCTEILDLPMGLLQRLTDVALRVCGLDKEDQEKN